ncbi:MAG TPA: protein-L-isoaspartate O-methyltransferase [Thermoplasmata archaeon]|nr:protein-L-isoaspartate O-methyltransferase [Thermoplasmata archaeon]
MTWEAEASAMVRSLGPLPPAIAAVMRRVPRHRFVPSSLRTQAYWDEPLPIGPGETTISAPHMVAIMLEWAELAAGLTVLEVGSGSGYLAALLAESIAPSGRVEAVEIDSELVRRSTEALGALGYAERVAVHEADGRAGWPPAAPYDRIVVSAASPQIEPAWREQLPPDGLLLVPLGNRIEQQFTRLVRRAGTETLEPGPAVRFVSLRPAESRIYRPAK